MSLHPLRGILLTGLLTQYACYNSPYPIPYSNPYIDTDIIWTPNDDDAFAWGVADDYPEGWLSVWGDNSKKRHSLYTINAIVPNQYNPVAVNGKPGQGFSGGATVRGRYAANLTTALHQAGTFSIYWFSNENVAEHPLLDTSFGGDGLGNGTTLAYDSLNQRLIYRTRSAGATILSAISANGSVPKNNAYLVTVRIQPGKYDIWLNGVLFMTGNPNPIVVAQASNAVALGNRADGAFVTPDPLYINAWALFTTPLSDERIAVVNTGMLALVGARVPLTVAVVGDSNTASNLTSWRINFWAEAAESGKYRVIYIGSQVGAPSPSTDLPNTLSDAIAGATSISILPSVNNTVNTAAPPNIVLDMIGLNDCSTTNFTTVTAATNAQRAVAMAWLSRYPGVKYGMIGIPPANSVTHPEANVIPVNISRISLAAELAAIYMVTYIPPTTIPAPSADFAGDNFHYNLTGEAKIGLVTSQYAGFFP